jgi:UDPglucose 6-dehydrogenase
VEIACRLAAEGARLKAYDPTVLDGAPELPNTLEVCADPYTACTGADVLVVLTEWDEFRWVDHAKVREVMAEPRIVDARNLLDPAALRRMGFTYAGVGRV